MIMMLAKFRGSVLPFFFKLLMLLVFLGSCKKTVNEVQEQPEPTPPVFAYEVHCDFCTITYNDLNGDMRTVRNSIGKWSFKISEKTPLNLKLSVVTTLSSYQSIQAYILKDGEVIYGDLGYNRAEIRYSTVNGNGTSSFGTYIPSASPGGSNQNGGASSSSSVCGAKNKSGGYCKRVVSGGGRCWQHG